MIYVLAINLFCWGFLLLLFCFGHRPQWLVEWQIINEFALKLRFDFVVLNRMFYGFLIFWFYRTLFFFPFVLHKHLSSFFLLCSIASRTVSRLNKDINTLGMDFYVLIFFPASIYFILICNLITFLFLEIDKNGTNNNLLNVKFLLSNAHIINRFFFIAIVDVYLIYFDLHTTHHTLSYRS